MKINHEWPKLFLHVKLEDSLIQLEMTQFREKLRVTNLKPIRDQRTLKKAFKDF